MLRSYSSSSLRLLMPGRIVDLSVSIANGMPAHRAFPKPVILPHYTHAGTGADGLGEPQDPFTSATSFITMVDHVGTHVNSFFHSSPTGKTIDDMPIEMFMGKAVCLDLTHIPDACGLQQRAASRCRCDFRASRLDPPKSVG